MKNRRENSLHRVNSYNMAIRWYKCFYAKPLEFHGITGICTIFSLHVSVFRVCRDSKLSCVVSNRRHGLRRTNRVAVNL